VEDVDLIEELRAELRDLAGDTDAPRLAEALALDGDRPVAVAVVGASGVGKSALVNALVRSKVADVGALRPTTRLAESFGPLLLASSIPHTVTDGDIVFVDTPPSDHDPATLDRVLDLVDAALVVTSRNRYADITTRTALERAEELGAERVLVVNRLERGDDLRAVITDAGVKTGMDSIPILEGALTSGAVVPVAAAVAEVAERIDELRPARRAALAVRLSAALRTEADLLRRAEEGRVAAASRVDEAFAAAADELKDMLKRPSVDVALSGDEVMEAIGGSIGEHLRPATEAAVGAITAAGREPPTLAEDDLMNADGAAVAAWRTGVEDAAVDALRPRWLRRWGRSAAQDASWRLVLDPEYMPPRRVRMLLGGRRSSIEQDGTVALSETISVRITARHDPHRRAVAQPGNYDADRLEQLASAIEAEYS